MAAIAVARAYQHSFDTRPNATLAVAGGALTALGDVVAQVTQNIRARRELHHTRPQYDAKRTLRFFIFGAAMSPFIGRWNKFLEWRFPLRSEGGKISMSSLTKRVAADQIIMAPIGLTMFLGGMGIMEGRDLNHIKGKFRDLYKEAIIANWKVWPAVQIINFRSMPLPYRVPFQQSCGVFWTLYLSLLNSSEECKQELEDNLRRTLD
ncbi:uncharacterized protein STEHIDRAFT_101589 [Stereum hirsutum FP-91666 SS1]|uniref:uncharacterized protein n=1 Tax=Stereum hirsutum (strain FP-91666) TaxID=721885 RepID=UPI0004449FC1|nr:uncharacterized protein STEHIDRAFT_101589 [Stereum hirsutum FP-91666 SS1]EIM83393.1 hypothetical protein STEHIDRAFT_101589 [Stereum hirsutum FP-91666 SS1]